MNNLNYNLNNNLKYVINPPKYSQTIYFKDIVVLVIENDKIIGARKYDYDGTVKVINYLDYDYDKHSVKHFENIKDYKNKMKNLLNDKREYWSFDSEEKAFIQKIWLLKNIRDYFSEQQQKEKKEFNKKLPSVIDIELNNIKNKKPEYFL